MMNSLYNQVCQISSKTTTQKYSTSFSLGILMFQKSILQPIYDIYGFVRFADEIVDTYSGNKKEAVFNEFKQEAFNAIERKISFNPIIHSFKLTFNRYEMDIELVKSFLTSMEMDLYQINYDPEAYKKYIYGSAEVVGLMCLHVFVNNPNEFKRLKPYALALGSAFQKVNFLRDLRSDYYERGRVYFPSADFTRFTPRDKMNIESEIESEFNYAFEGIKQLPKSCRFGVLLAYKYYAQLFRKIKAQPIESLLNNRVRISNLEKIFILLRLLIFRRVCMLR